MTSQRANPNGEAGGRARGLWSVFAQELRNCRHPIVEGGFLGRTCYNVNGVGPTVGATGIDGAIEGPRLREEVVGHLLKLPAHAKMPTLAC